MNYSYSGTIGYRESAQFKSLFLDFVEGKLFESEFYPYSGKLQDYERVFSEIQQKKIDRDLLVHCLEGQYSTIRSRGIHHYALLEANFKLLQLNNSFTVCTGHQLCVFGGPLFLFTKILSVINRCEALKKLFPEMNFIPVFWMASEDHDIDEIRSVSLFGQSVHWETKEEGRAGKLRTDGLPVLIDEIEKLLENIPSKQYIVQHLRKSYSDFQNLADATRYFLHELFGTFGLIIVDGDDKLLKQSFEKVVLKDVLESVSYTKVKDTIHLLEEKNYLVQVSPREVNYFYTGENFRERIKLENNLFRVQSNDRIYSYGSITDFIKNEIENISPNVVTRPLYQQTILPNVEYVGGPGEIAYWLEYFSMFKEMKITFPILRPRDFIILIDSKNHSKLEETGIKLNDLFLSPELIHVTFLKRKDLLFTLDEERKEIEDIMQRLSNRISKIDSSLVNASEANFQKFYAGLDQLTQKVNRSLKQRNEVFLKRIEQIRTKILPENTMMERVNSPLTFIASDEKFIQSIKNILKENSSEDGIKVIVYG